MNLLGLDIYKIADNAFYNRGSTEKTMSKLKKILNDLYERRNIIAHQFDRQHTNAVKKEISQDLVMNFIEDVSRIVEAVNTLILEK